MVRQHQHVKWLMLMLMVLQGSFLAVVVVESKATPGCKQVSPCFFDCGHQVMDLTALKHTMYKDVTDSKGQNKFSYNPCGTFDEGAGCHDTHVCQVAEVLDEDKNDTVDVGSQLKASLHPSSDNNALVYTHTTPDHKTRVTTVKLKCVSANDVMADQFSVKGEFPDGSRHYEMTLTSQHACFQAKDSTTTPVTAPPTTAGTNETTSVKPTHHVTTEKHHPTTHNTQPTTSNATTEPSPNTTDVTTPASSNVTTPASSNVTTPTSPSNVTTAPMTTENVNVTTTAPKGGNVTTEVTTVVTMTTEGGNATTPAGTNVTSTAVLTNTTTAFVTTQGSSAQTTQGVITTTSGAPTSRRGGIERVVLGWMLLTVVTVWNGL